MPKRPRMCMDSRDSADSSADSTVDAAVLLPWLFTAKFVTYAIHRDGEETPIKTLVFLERAEDREENDQEEKEEESDDEMELDREEPETQTAEDDREIEQMEDEEEKDSTQDEEEEDSLQDEEENGEVEDEAVEEEFDEDDEEEEEELESEYEEEIEEVKKEIEEVKKLRVFEEHENGFLKQQCDQLHAELLREQQHMEKMMKPIALPKGLKFGMKLKTHQIRALNWMHWRENGAGEKALRGLGGILGDECGLGKTITMLALVQHSKQREYKHSSAALGSGLIASTATLVVATTSLMQNWTAEAERMFEGLDVFIFHGNSRHSVGADELSSHDVVVTSYNVLIAEFAQRDEAKSKKADRLRHIPDDISDSVLGQIHWKRLILDEAHHIRNAGNLDATACRRLAADHRWTLSGTIIQNSSRDLFSIFRFLRVKQFALENEAKCRSVWTRFYKTQKKGPDDRLQVLLNVMMLRRMKNSQECKIVLPPFKMERHLVNLQGVELQMFTEINKIAFHQYHAWIERMREEHKNRQGTGGWEPPRQMKQRLATKNPFKKGEWRHSLWGYFDELNPLKMLVRLRQCSVHFALMRNDIEIMNICNSMRGAAELFDMKTPSGKITAILSCVQKIVQKKEKCVIVSEWRSALNIVGKHLKANAIEYLQIDGKTQIFKRTKKIDLFARSKRRNVLLLTTDVGGEGLNLQSANHMLIVEPHWNPQREKQAEHRLYRIGQQKPVTIHRFITPSVNGEFSVEQVIEGVQNDKINEVDGIYDNVVQFSRKMDGGEENGAGTSSSAADGRETRAHSRKLLDRIFLGQK